MFLLSNLHKLVDKGTFSIAFVAEKGEIVAVKEAVCTSFHSKGRTMNIKIPISKQLRTIRRCTIIAFNDQEVAL